MLVVYVWWLRVRCTPVFVCDVLCDVARLVCVFVFCGVRVCGCVVLSCVVRCV